MVEQVEVKDDTADAADADAASAERRPEEKPTENIGQRPSPPDEGGEGAPNAWSDEAAESAFRSEARARGESVTAAVATIEAREDNDTKPLPPLADLVKRLPPEVREALDDLFRVKFTTVRRVPKQALKSAAG